MSCTPPGDPPRAWAWTTARHPAKLDKYGDEILATVAAALEA